MKSPATRTLHAALASAALLALAALPLSASDTPPAPAPAATPAAAVADSVLVRAIAERRVLTFTYGGHPRTVEPHAYGIATTGEIVLHAYQTSTGSVSGKPPGWRTFNAAEITALSVTSHTFAAPRPDYTAERPRLSPLWAEVAPPAP